MKATMESVTDWLFGLTKFGKKNGLENIRELLKRLGNPQDSFRSIHVAGSDGKGSTCSLMYSVMREAGIHAGMFSSPHILVPNERISVDGKNISDDDFIRLALTVQKTIDGMRKDDFACTFFEAITAMGFLYFRETGVEYAIVETGMGGRLDATNVLIPEVSVISSISLEHTQYLGDTLAKIAYEKAGIIKPGVPVVTCTEGEAFEVIASVAREKGSELISTKGAEFLSGDPYGTDIRYKGKEYRIGIPGSFQSSNAAMAVEALSRVYAAGRLKGHIEKGFERASWPGRMQKVEGYPVIIDVTHTAAGMRILANDIRRIHGSVVTVFGVLDDKDVDGMSEYVSKMSDWVIVTQPKSDRALSLTETFCSMTSFTDGVERASSVPEAIETALMRAGGRMIVVTGSFAMAEEAFVWLSTRFKQAD